MFFIYVYLATQTWKEGKLRNTITCVLADIDSEVLESSVEVWKILRTGVSWI